MKRWTIICGVNETKPEAVLASMVGARGLTITSASQLMRTSRHLGEGDTVYWLATPHSPLSAGRKKVHIALTKAMLDYIPKLRAKGVTVV